MSSGARSSEVVELRSHRDGETVIYADAEDHVSRFDGEIDRPSRVGRYVVLEVLGVGGMGIVCTAYDPKLERKVAVKLLRNPGRPGSHRSKTGRARLVREAQALAKLSHPNIVTVHDVDVTDDGRLYMAMEYVEGRTLSKWVAATRPGWREILEVFDHAGRGLAAAHAAGIVHRDFKPANVLIGKDGRVRVLDFGLAKTGSDSGESADDHAQLSAHDIMDVVHSATDLKLTGAGRVLGTPAYMAPEQRRSGEVGPAADQFGFAVALFEALYGVLPFRGPDPHGDATAGEIVEPPRDTQVPAWVLRVLRRALMSDPRARYPRMNDFLAALRADPARRRQRILASIGGVAVAGLGIWGAVAAAPAGQEVCAGARTRLDATWGDAQKAALGDALRATGTSYAEYTANRVTEALDRWAEGWTDARVSVCEATRVHGEQSEALLDVRMTCLDQRQAEVEALVGVLVDADASVVERAVGAVLQLQDPRACSSAQPGVETSLPADPSARERVLVVQAQIDEAEANLAAGRYAAAASKGSEAIDASAEVQHPRTKARAHYVTGVAERLLGRNDKAEALLERAGLLAAEAGDAATEAGAWTKLAYLTGVERKDSDRGLTWATAARSAIIRAGAPKELELDLESDTAAILLASNRLEEALAHQEAALGLAREAYDGDHPGLVNAYGNLGITLTRLGRAEDGEEHLREALSEAEKILGRQHPEVASKAHNLAIALVDHEEDSDEARALLERGLAIRTETFGAEHPRTAELLIPLAEVEKRAGRFDRAEGHYRRALQIFEQAGDTRRVTNALNNLAVLLREQNRTDEARRTFEASRARFVAEFGESALFVAQTDNDLCQVALRQERFTDARKHCERALPLIAEAFPKPHRRVAQVQLDLAAALKGAGDRAGAKRWVADARGVLDALAEPAPDLAELADRIAAGL
jgi:tetratricopeptide (TPR) repeat protein/predicted Ser/Thr protein kinase